MKTYKGVMILLDGLGDRPSKKLDGKTPLEAADTPHMDRLATAGLGGLVSLMMPWLPVGTQTGMGLLMGLPRRDIYKLARGPVEAAGIDLQLAEGDIAIRGNFATLRPDGDRFDILDRRAGRIATHTRTLCDALDNMELDEGITTRVRAATEHRFVLSLSGHDLSDAITDTDPGAGHKAEGLQWCEARDETDFRAVRTAAAVNTFIRRSYDLLKEHPVNAERSEQGLPPATGVITRGAGRFMPVRNLVGYLGLKAALVTGEATVKGLGHLFGFTVIQDPRFTGRHVTDLTAKIAATCTALDDHDLVFLHIKGTDTYAHDCNPAGKKKLIETIDRAIEPLLTRELVIALTGDHSTDSTWGMHIGDPVPALIAAPHIRADAVRSFSETDCAGGGLGHVAATSFLCAFLDHMNRLHNYRPHEYFFY